MKLVSPFLVATLFCTSSLNANASGTAATKQFSALPAAAQSSISAVLGRELDEYHARPTAHGFEAHISHGPLTAHFTAAGVQFTSGILRWTMSLRAYGYGDALVTTGKAAPSAHQNRVEYRHGSLDEWYENGPVGLEQGFTIQRRPGHSSGKPLTIALAMLGDLHAQTEADGQGLRLVDSHGVERLQYSNLSAQDASGKELDASLQVKGERILLRVNDDGAQYPLTIDPLIQFAELTALNGANGNQFGISVAMSGNTVVVAAPEAINSGIKTGAAYVFIKPANGWANMTQTAKLAGSTGKGCCSAVAIDGDTIVTSGIDLTTYEDEAFVFVEPPSGWKNMSQTAVLTLTDDGPDGGINALAISDGTILAGSWLSMVFGFEEGEAYIFVKPAGGWTDMTQTAILSPSDGASSDNFGISVGLSGDVAVIGAELAGGDRQGAAYVFVEPAGGWVNMNQTSELTASDGGVEDEFGVSVTVDGATIAVGASNATVGSNRGQGAVYVFVEPINGWQNTTETAKLTASTGKAENAFGYSVSASGNAILVGAPNVKIGVNAVQGAAYIFNKPPQGWVTTAQPNVKFSAGIKGSGFGASLTLSGATALVGAPTGLYGINKKIGAAYVFGP